MMKLIKYPSKEQWAELLKRPALNTESLFDTVRTIINKVRAEGDKAVLEYEAAFDKVTLSALTVTSEEIQKAEGLISDELKSAITLAKRNIETFHSSQRFVGKKVETMEGVTCWQKAVGIEKVGLYIPGGTAPLFSTVLMLAVPAKIAGCREIVLCTPPDKNGNIHPAILFAAQLAGVSKIFKAGGVQAIAAMAYGTESVPKVYKIFGPGNQYVTAAKQLVSLRDVAIDMPAGPSEVEVLADASANPVFVAADLLSQAEHGVDSQAMLITTSEKLQAEVMEEVNRQLAKLPRREIAAKSLENSKLILVKDMDEALELTNAYAPEHLIVETENYLEVAERVINAGSVFLGSLTPESAGDYASGTNHTLPTNGYAKAYSGVSLDSFIRKITFQEILPQGMKVIGPAIEEMAANELLTVGTNKYYFNTNGVMATGLTNIGGVTYLFGADGAMQYGWYTDASGMRYFQTNGAMAVNTTLAVGGVTYVFDANGLATAVPVINPATWVTDPATGVTIDTATGAVVPAETVAAAAAAAIAQK